MKLPKIRCKYIYDFKTNELYWVCQNCYTQILDNKKDKTIICPKCKNIVKEKKMSSYTITFEMTETIEAEDKQSAIEEFIEKLKNMNSEKIAKVLEVRWYE